LFGHVSFGRSQLAVQIFQQVLALFGVGFFGREGNVGFDVIGQRG
jgi:hypothetical protein